jgi:inner membrane protein
MDSITQIVLGAAVGEAVAGKEIGNKAAFWGAIAGTIPDLDVLFMGLFNPIDASLFHRGFSHSLLFACISGPLLGILLHRISKRKIRLKTWISLFFLGILTHPMLDMFTTYGTSFLWPLNERIAFNTVFVIDPFYTIPFVICLILAMRLPKTDVKRFQINLAGIVYSCSYLLLGVVMKLTILTLNNSTTDKTLFTERTSVSPMPLTLFYWMNIKEDRNHFYISHTSIFHPNKNSIPQIIPKNHHLLKKVQFTIPSDLKKIEFFSKGYFTVEKSSSSLQIYDLRFGLQSPLTKGKINKPLMGFTFQLDQNDKILKFENLRASDIMQKIDFNNYVHQIFFAQ